MATDPFTGALVTRLQDRIQAYRFNCVMGEVAAFKFYCCDNAPVLGVEKPPVCIMSVTPETQCTAVNVTFNIDASYSPTGNLAGQPWRIDYGDGGFAAGNWGPPGNQLYAYAAAGIYTAEAYVTDTLGVRGTTEVTVEVVACASDAVLIEQMYALSQTAGPHVRDMTVAVPAWAQRIVGLAGNWLNGRDLKLDPHRKHLPYGARHVWIATQAGVAKSTDDMANWSRLYNLMNDPRNTAGDGVPPVKANLDWVCIAFNPLVRDEVYVLAYDTVAPVRSFVYFTYDGGLTWDNWEVAI
jgi:PKD repeat protein